MSRLAELTPPRHEGALLDDRFIAALVVSVQAKPAKQTDAGFLYYRTDQVDEAPATWQAVYELAERNRGIVYQGAAYEGLTVDFLEIAYANGGRVFTEDGTASAFDSPEHVEALRFMVEGIRDDFAVEQAKPRPVTPLYPQVSEAIYSNVNEALGGAVSPEAAIPRRRRRDRARARDVLRPRHGVVPPLAYRGDRMAAPEWSSVATTAAPSSGNAGCWWYAAGTQQGFEDMRIGGGQSASPHPVAGDHARPRPSRRGTRRARRA